MSTSPRIPAQPERTHTEAMGEFVHLAVGKGPDVVRLCEPAYTTPDDYLKFSGEALREHLNAAHVAGLPLDVYVSMVALRAAAEAAAQKPYTFNDGNITVDPSRYRVRRQGRPVDMSPIEYRLAAFLGRNPGLPYTRAALFSEVWGQPNTGCKTRTVEVHINRVRVKLGAEAIITCAGKGTGYTARP